MNNCIIEYICIDSNQKLISETHIFNNINNIPNLYNSNNIIKPCLTCKDYFRESNSYLVLCETLDSNEIPIITNTRNPSDIFHIVNYDKMEDDNEPFFIFTQKYNLSLYNQYSQNIIEEHLQACLYANLKISKINLGFFNIGPCYGINASDQLYMAMFLLEKIAAKYNILITYKQNILYFSTKQTREPDSINIIYDYIKKLQFQNITFRIPYYTLKNNSGYFEILNSSNLDPYTFTSFIYKICCLD